MTIKTSTEISNSYHKINVVGLKAKTFVFTFNRQVATNHLYLELTCSLPYLDGPFSFFSIVTPEDYFTVKGTNIIVSKETCELAHV